MMDDRQHTTDRFLRGLLSGALVGAVIAGSTIWERRRRRSRPTEAPPIETPPIETPPTGPGRANDERPTNREGEPEAAPD